MNPETTIVVTTSRDLLVGIAAVIQALAAIAIFFLTRRLVNATETYAADTKRMARLLEQERQLHYQRQSEDAARELVSAARNALPFYRTGDQWNRGYPIWEKAWLDHAESILEADVRECVDRMMRVLGVAPEALGAATPDRYGNPIQKDKLHVADRIQIAFLSLIEVLGAYMRGEPRPDCGLPEPGAESDYLRAGLADAE